MSARGTRRGAVSAAGLAGGSRSRVRRTPALLLAATALAGLTAGCSGVSLSSASSSPSSAKSPASSTSTAAEPTKPPAPPDATLADLSDIVVPAYCQQPPTRLHNGTIGPTSEPSTSPGEGASSARTSTSSASTAGSSATSSGGSANAWRPGRPPGASRTGPSGYGELSMTGPESPVLADVNGDGAKEVVAQYTCNAGGTTWPAMVVIVKHGGEVIGNVKLGDIARTDHAHVTAWRPTDGGLAVDWVAYEGEGHDKRPFENLLSLGGSTLSFAPTERGRSLGQTTIVDGAGTSSFVTPTGKIACTLDGTKVTCAASQPSWKPEGDPGCGTVDAVVLRNGTAAYGCTSGAPFREAAGNTAPRWQRQGSDPTIRTQYGEAAGLAFGRTLTTGQVTCTAAMSGVTCTDPLSGHGFTVTGDTARLF